MKRPRVTLNCPADKHALDGERIVEFSDHLGRGGLISFQDFGGVLRVEVYRVDADVRVDVPEKNQARRTA
jgi:hypothetical protein